MADQQPWGETPQPGQQDQNQYGQHGPQAGQTSHQGQWAQGDYAAQHARHVQQEGAGLAALRPFFTPLYVAGASSVLFLLTLLGYWLSWKSFSEDGDKATFNGFGLQKATYDGESTRNLVTGFYLLGLFVLLLIVAAAVLALTTVYQKIAALCLSVAGGIGVFYSCISLFTDFGMDRNFMGMTAGPDGDSIDWGLSPGIFVALVVSLVTVVFGVLCFLSVQGPLLPVTAPSAPATGPAAALRPVYVAAGTVVLFLLLVLSYILNWRTASDNSGDVSVNGLGLRTMEFTIYGETGKLSDISLLPLFCATFAFALILLGALVLCATVWKKTGALVIAAGAALALLTAFTGLVSDYGMFRDMAGEDLSSGYTPSTSASVGVFLALFFSLMLLVVAVLYLLVDFGIIGGATRPQQFGQQFGQAPEGQPGQPQWNQYGQAPQQPQQGQPGQQYPPQNPGQIPPAPGRW